MKYTCFHIPVNSMVMQVKISWHKQLLLASQSQVSPSVKKKLTIRSKCQGPFRCRRQIPPYTNGVQYIIIITAATQLNVGLYGYLISTMMSLESKST